LIDFVYQWFSVRPLVVQRNAELPLIITMQELYLESGETCLGYLK
jgi:hypothetical protein